MYAIAAEYSFYEFEFANFLNILFMEKKNCFQKILFVGILISLLLSSCNDFLSSSLEFDDADVELVSFAYDWKQSTVGDTVQLSCKQTLVYSSYGKEITLFPSAYVKLWVKRDTILSTSEAAIKPTTDSIASVSSSLEGMPIRHKLCKAFELDDSQMVMAEIFYEDFNLSSQETGEILPHLEISDFALDDICINLCENSNNNYIVSVSFNVPWYVVHRGDRGTEKAEISYIKSSVDNADDQLFSINYDTGTEWVTPTSFKLFISKTETWKISGIKNSKIYSPVLPFVFNASDKPSLMVDSLDFMYQVSLNQSKTEQIDADKAWNIQKCTAIQTICFSNGAYDFTHAFSYPIYKASAFIDGREIFFDLEPIFDFNIKTSKFGDYYKKITSSASIAFGNRTFDTSCSTLLVLYSSDISDNQNTDYENNAGLEIIDNPSSLKYGRIIDFYISAVLDADAYQIGGAITKKAIVVRFDKGYLFGICKYNEDFPSQFLYTQSDYAGFNSVAQPEAGKAFRIARAVVYKDAIKWFDEDNSLIIGIDNSSCGIFGWENIINGLYSAFIDSYDFAYSSDRYSLTLSAPSGRTLLIQSYD